MRKKYVIFGAGFYGKIAINHLEKDNISYIVDNNPEKNGLDLLGVPIFSFDEKVDELRKKEIIISVKEETCKEIENQLLGEKITNYKTIFQLEQEMVHDRINESEENIETYDKAIQWIREHTLKDGGIMNTTSVPKGYPEVTGYFIPSLLAWGHRELAMQYAVWLCSTQKEDGSWGSYENRNSFVFDTAQIVKGLLSIHDWMPEVKNNIIRACDWLTSNIREDGRLPAVDPNTWGDGSTLSELVHIYCLSPLKDAGEKFERPDYIACANKVLRYYIENYREKILDFHLLSHFYAYVIEGLIDMGEIDLAQEAMNKIAELQSHSGSVPGYKNVNWICSTGLFQFAVIWFKLGDLSRGEKAFSYACKLQNESGGWYGSYPQEKGKCEEPTYIPDAEISWAVKYFLDALKYQGQLIADMRSDFFIGEIGEESSTYHTLMQTIKDAKEEKHETIKVLDMGCGKGVQLRQLKKDIPGIHFCAVDITEKTLSCIAKEEAETKLGSLTNIPYPDRAFDVVYTCEAMEHAIDIENAVKELARVTKTGGIIIIIDKVKESLEEYLIEKWEQFFDEEELKELMENYCDKVTIIHGIGHSREERTMSAWIGRRA